MTKQQKRIAELTNKELIDELCQTIEANAFKCAHKGYITNTAARLEDELRAEAIKRWCKE